MFGLGMGELIVIFVIALIFIGPKKLPELAKGLGKGIRDFQNAMKDMGTETVDRDQYVKPEEPKIVDASHHDDDVEENYTSENKDKTQS